MEVYKMSSSNLRKSRIPSSSSEHSY